MHRKHLAGLHMRTCVPEVLCQFPKIHSSAVKYIKPITTITEPIQPNPTHPTGRLYIYVIVFTHTCRAHTQLSVANTTYAFYLGWLNYLTWLEIPTYVVALRATHQIS